MGVGAWEGGKECKKIKVQMSRNDNFRDSGVRMGKSWIISPFWVFQFCKMKQLLPIISKAYMTDITCHLNTETARWCRYMQIRYHSEPIGSSPGDFPGPERSSWVPLSSVRAGWAPGWRAADGLGLPKLPWVRQVFNSVSPLSVSSFQTMKLLNSFLWKWMI